MSLQQPPPTPQDAYEAERWRHTRLRRDMLDERSEEHVFRRVLEQVGPVRTAAWGQLDLAASPLAVVCNELATLYLAGPPEIRHSGSTKELSDAIGESGLWASMSRYQAWVIGCREYLLRIHATEEGQLRYRAVPPDLVLAAADPEVPDVPVSIMELRWRELPGTEECIWAWDILDVSDPEAPVYRVRSTDASAKDLTTTFLGGPQSGDMYPYRRADGTPVLPYAMHHAERLGDRLWDWNRGRGLVEGTLNLAMMRSYLLHVVKDASHPQRWSENGRPAGLETVDQNGKTVRREIVTDPATLLVLERIDKNFPVQVGQFKPGGDPLAILEVIKGYAAWLLSDAGMSGSDLLRTSGDPRSGYALSLSNEGKRAAQRRFTPQFRDADQRLIATSAILRNRATGGSLPEDGYSVAYATIPLSPEELKARDDHLLEMLAAGLMSRSDAYLEQHPGLTREQALAELQRIDLERKTAPPPQPAPKPIEVRNG